MASASETLRYALDHGMIDLTRIQEQIDDVNRKEILERHPYQIWEGKNGKWYTYLPDDVKRKLKKRNTKREIEDVVVEYWSRTVSGPTVRDTFCSMNDRKLRLGQISPSTHTRNAQIFARHFKTFGERPMAAIDVWDVVKFLEEQIPEYGLTSKAFANLRCVMGAIIKYARREKLIDFTMADVLQEMDTSDRVFVKTVKKDTQEVFTAAETDTIMRYLIENQDVWNLGILLLFVTGLRVGELVALEWEDISDGAIYVHRTETRYRTANGTWEYRVKDSPKTEAGVRTVAVPQAFQWIFAAIRMMHDDERYVFVHDEHRLNTNCIRKRFSRVCDKAGVPRRSPHKIRKTYCSILFENGVDPKLITDQMGHTDIMCSEMYYHKNRKSLDEKVETISAIPDFKAKMTLDRLLTTF